METDLAALNQQRSQLVTVPTEMPAREPGDVYSEEHPGMSITQVLSILRAYLRISAAIFCAITLLTAAGVYLLPRTYTAVATLMVNPDTNDPLGGKELPSNMLSSFVETQIELMLSAEFLDPVIDRLGLVNDPEYSKGNSGGEATLHDWVEAKLRHDLDISQGRSGSQLIYISASARTAAGAAAIANAMADTYTSEVLRRSSGPASERANRYSEELSDLKRKVALAQDAVTRYRSTTGAIDQDAKIDLDLDVLTRMEHRVVDARSALHTNESRVSSDHESGSVDLNSASLSSLHAEEAKLREKMATLRTQYGPNHPAVLELQSQIEANRKSLDITLNSIAATTKSDINMSNTEVAALEKAVNDQRRKVAESRRLRDEGAKLQLELESAQSVYKRALEGYDQIMFASNARLSNVSIASRARPPVRPDKSGAIKYLMLGGMLALGLGAGGPFAYELLHRRVRCRDDVERVFGVPVLTELPVLPALMPGPKSRGGPA